MALVETKLIESELKDTSRELERYRLSIDDVQVTDKELGRGSFASVVELEYRGLRCAGKRFHSILLGDHFYVKRYSQECCLHTRLRHPNIVHFLGVFYEKPDSESTSLPILVMELLPINLLKCIKQHGILPKEINYSILKDVSLGLDYLHNQIPPIMHRNLSSNSILLTSNFTAKISSLHMATPCDPQNLEHTQIRIPGSIPFMPPEAFVEHPKYDTTLDVFSFGVVMIHVFSGQNPVPSESVFSKPDGSVIPLSEANRRDKYFSTIGRDHPLMDLILKCISNHPPQRGNMSEIVQRLKDAMVHFPTSFANKLEMLSKIDILEEIKTNLEAESVQKDKEIEQERSTLEHRVESAVANVQEEHQRQQRALQYRMEKAIAESKAENQQELRALDQRAEKTIAQIRAEHQQELRALEQRMDKTIAQIKAEHQQELRALEQLTEKVVADAEVKNQQERSALQQRVEEVEADASAANRKRQEAEIQALAANRKRQEAEIQAQETGTALQEAENNICSLLQSVDDAEKKANTRVQEELRVLEQRVIEAEAEVVAANQKRQAAEKQAEIAETALQDSENTVCSLLQSLDAAEKKAEQIRDAEAQLDDVTRQLQLASLRAIDSGNAIQHVVQELSGVEVCAETTLTVNNLSQHFHWNGYGLALHFPDGCLPADVEKCFITIKASLAGQYEFPQGSHLVSAVYWLRCEPRCRFTKAIAVEIEHCAPRENTDKLNVVRSHCTQEQLPYTFQKLRWGKFTEQNSYGYIDLNSFSGLCITQDESEEREYCAGLYYLEKTRLNPEIHFVVHWDNEAHLTHVRRQYSLEGAVKGSHFTFSFESDAITLDIPREGIAVSDVWRIEPLTPLIVTKKKVDSFKPRRQKMIPSCQLQAILARRSIIGDADTIPVLTHKINLRGARQPFGFLTVSFIPCSTRTVRSHLTQQQHRETLDSQAESEKPRLKLLLKELNRTADMWEDIGIQLDIDDGQLAVVRSEQRTNCLACLREMLRLWLKRVSPPPTWSAVIEAIDSLGNEALALELRQKYTLRIP